MRSENEMALQAVHTDVEARPITLQDGMGLLPVEQQNKMLAEYDERRNNFLQWLFSHLEEGVHYGFPPGCGGGKDTNEWKRKPSLYKAGAILIVDILKLKAAYSPDVITWEMAGKKNGLICRKCEMYASGELLGEGSGAFEVGEKKMNANSAIKMADKRALVAAVINSVPIVGELFTQDIDDGQKPLTARERQFSLKDRIESELIEHSSQWDGTTKDFIHKLARQLINGQPLNTIGAIDAFEAALNNASIDWNTAEVLPE